MDFAEMSDDQLKVLHYDTVQKLTAVQQDLGAIDAEIRRRADKPTKKSK